MNDWTEAEEARFIRSIKGVSSLSDPKVTRIIKKVTRRDLANPIDNRSVIQAATIGSASNGAVSITDPTGKLYAMTNIIGFAEGATLK